VLLSVLYGTYGVRDGGSLDLEQSHTVRVVTKRGARERREGAGDRREEGRGGMTDGHEVGLRTLSSLFDIAIESSLSSL
jgi:hypothetical protein